MVQLYTELVDCQETRQGNIVAFFTCFLLLWFLLSSIALVY